MTRALRVAQMGPECDLHQHPHFRPLLPNPPSHPLCALPPAACKPGMGLNWSDQCELCSPGYYNDKAQVNVCQQCPEGSISLTKGAKSCTMCTAPNTIPSGGRDACGEGPCTVPARTPQLLSSNPCMQPLALP